MFAGEQQDATLRAVISKLADSSCIDPKHHVSRSAMVADYADAYASALECSQRHVAINICALSKPDVSCRYHAAENLAKLGSKAKRAIPELLRVLRDDRNALVRKSAVFALGEIGSELVVPGLQRAAKWDEDSFVRKQAMQTLDEMGYFVDCLVVSVTV